MANKKLKLFEDECSTEASKTNCGNEKLQMLKKKVDSQTVFAMMLFALLLGVTFLTSGTAVFAASDASADVVTGKFNSLKDLVSGIVSSIGSIVTLWGISEWGIAFQGSEGTMQANAFKRIGGGFVMAMAPQILAALI